MADIVIIAQMADVVGFVVNSRKTNKWIIKNNLNKLLDKGVNNIGIILNKMPQHNLDYGNYGKYYKEYFPRSLKEAEETRVSEEKDTENASLKA